MGGVLGGLCVCMIFPCPVTTPLLHHAHVYAAAGPTYNLPMAGGHPGKTNS